jgi:5-methylcytosine-specific restriction endonuclease McrA
MPYKDREKRNAHQREKRALDPERQRELDRLYYQKQADKKKAYQKRYRAANADLVRQKKKVYAEAHGDEIRRKKREWAASHPEERRARAKASYQRNIERVREYTRKNSRKRVAHLKKWKAENPEKVRAHNARRKAIRRKAEGQGWTAADVANQLKAQKQRCFYCRKKLRGKYHCDHVIPVARGGRHCRSNMVIACPPCNIKKRDYDPQAFAGILL